jgi:hypothetical protein
MAIDQAHPMDNNGIPFNSNYLIPSQLDFEAGVGDK